MHRNLRKARLQRIKVFKQISVLIYVITKSNNKKVKTSYCILRINARHFKDDYDYPGVPKFTNL